MIIPLRCCTILALSRSRDSALSLINLHAKSILYKCHNISNTIWVTYTMSLIVIGHCKTSIALTIPCYKIPWAFKCPSVVGMPKTQHLIGSPFNLSIWTKVSGWHEAFNFQHVYCTMYERKTFNFWSVS